jgi:hypothetical protein
VSDASVAIVRCVDHLVVPVRDPVAAGAAVAELLGVKTDGPQHHEAFASSMFFLGNVWLEVAHFPDYRGPLDRVMSIAFEPVSIESSAEELDRRGIAHDAPARVDGPMGWTTMGVNGLLGGRVGIFFCEYTFDRTPEQRAAIRAQYGKVAASIDDRRRWAREDLRRAGGGLGIDAVTEVVIATPDVATERVRWQAFLAPTRAHESDDGRWRLGDGPTLRLVDGPWVDVIEIRVAVASVSGARQALAARGIETILVEGELRVAAGLGATIGLRFTETASAHA